MSSANAITATLLLISYVTGLTGMICTNYAVQTVYDFADVAHMQEFGLATWSGNADWYREGMQLFAFKDTGKKWNKRTVTWSVMNVPENMSRTSVTKIMSRAFKKWAKVTPFTFKKITRKEQPDIRIQFGPMKRKASDLSNVEYPKGKIFDEGGIDIFFNHTHNWTEINGPGWYNLRAVALHAVGRSLGLGRSTCSRAVMYKKSKNTLINGDIDLGGDDIRGIQAMYGAPSSAASTSGTAAPTAGEGGTETE